MGQFAGLVDGELDFPRPHPGTVDPVADVLLRGIHLKALLERLAELSGDFEAAVGFLVGLAEFFAHFLVGDGDFGGSFPLLLRHVL